MKIKHINGLETDTSNLTDIEEMILVKWSELQKICVDNNRPFTFFLNTNGDAKEYTIFWHHVGRNNSSPQGDIDISPLISIFKQYIEGLSQNKLSIKLND